MPLSPSPTLSRGSGNTGRGAALTHANAGSAQSYYQPRQGMAYAPRTDPARARRQPTNTGGYDDGAALICGSKAYLPSRVAYAVYTQAHWQREAEWQQYDYPPARRDLISAQVPQKYKLGNTIVPARPFPPANYFLGYTPTGTIGRGVSTTSFPLGS